MSKINTDSANYKEGYDAGIARAVYLLNEAMSDMFPEWKNVNVKEFCEISGAGAKNDS